MQELEYSRDANTLFSGVLPQGAYSTVSSAPNTAKLLSWSISSVKGIFRHWEPTENVLLLPLRRFAPVPANWIILVGDSGLWNAVLGEEPGLDASLNSTEVSQNLSAVVLVAFWITSLRRALKMLARNPDELCLKDYEIFLKWALFLSFSSKNLFFFFFFGSNLKRKNNPKQIKCVLWMVSLFLCQSSIGRPVFCLHLVEFTVYFEKRVVNHSQNIWHVEGLKLSQCKPGVIFFCLPKTYCYWTFLMGILWC